MLNTLNKKYSVSVVGCTGLVGSTLLDILQTSNLPLYNFNFYASKKSVGKQVVFKGEKYSVKELTENFETADFNFFMTDSNVSKKFITKIKGNGIIIDNSAAFRLKKTVPLIIPEINYNLINQSKLISNPNCSTAICAIPIYHLKKLYGIKKIIITTLQSLSGCGQIGLDCLNSNGNSSALFSYDIKQTCIPKIGNESEFNYTEEEFKMVNEMRKILNDYELNIAATCVRVPIPFCHSASVFVECENKISIEDIISVFSSDNQLKISDDLSMDIYPNSITAYKSNKVFIGRIRKDLNNPHGLHFYLTSDNLRRGAAYNAYKIMEYFISNDSL